VVVPGVISMLMLTSKSWTEKRSVVAEVSLVPVMSAEMASAAGSVTVSAGNGPAAAAADAC